MCEAFIIKRDEGCMTQTIKIHKGGSLRSDLNNHNESHAVIDWYTTNNCLFFFFYIVYITGLRLQFSMRSRLVFVFSAVSAVLFPKVKPLLQC